MQKSKYELYSFLCQCLILHVLSLLPVAKDNMAKGNLGKKWLIYVTNTSHIPSQREVSTRTQAKAEVEIIEQNGLLACSS